MSKPTIPLFDRNRGHPSVPTWLLPERCAQARSRMPLAAPAKPARRVLDGAEHGAILFSQGRHHLQRGYRPSQKCLIIGGESPLYP